MSRLSFNARLVLGAAAAACVALSGAASAEAQDGDWYMGLTMPLMFIDDTDSTSTGSYSQPQGMVEYTANVKTEHDTGFKFGGMIGRHLGSGLRVEGEIFMARADVSRLTNSSITVPAFRMLPLPSELPIPVSGSAEQLGAMVNLWYDFDAGGTWTPYIGGGLGFVRVDQGSLRYDTGAVAAAVANALAQAAQPGIPSHLVPVPDAPPISGTDTAFAYQIGGGIGYALSDSTTLQVGYRLQMVNGLSYGGSNDALTISSNTDLRIHFLEIGIRFRF